MANSLTATTSKSTYFYFGLIVLFAMSLIYLWFIKSKNIEKNLSRNAFNMSAEALENSIYLANLKYLSQTKQRQHIDVWIEKDIGLDFNSNGFPVGTSLLQIQIDAPVSLKQCENLWNFMNPIQPLLDKSKKHFYWAEIGNKGRCNFLSTQQINNRIIYNEKTGQVFIKEVQK